jgi:hypothetical protein
VCLESGEGKKPDDAHDHQENRSQNCGPLLSLTDTGDEKGKSEKEKDTSDDPCYIFIPSHERFFDVYSAPSVLHSSELMPSLKRQGRRITSVS